MPDSLLASLKSAVQAAPNDVPLRVHLASLLDASGDHEGAVRHAAAALHASPADDDATTLMRRLLDVTAAASATDQDAGPAGTPTSASALPAGYSSNHTAPRGLRMPAELAHAAKAAQDAALAAEAAQREAAARASNDAALADSRRRRRESLARLADDRPAPDVDHLGAGLVTPSGSAPAAGVSPPEKDADAPFVPLATSAPAVATPAPTAAFPTTPAAAPDHAAAPTSETSPFHVAPQQPAPPVPPVRTPSGWGSPDAAGAGAPAVTLADVGGLEEAKERIEALLIAPLRNPSLRRLYGRGLAGGVVYYGPPGAGKTYLASAIAGELGAAFLPVDLADPRHGGHDLDSLATDVVAHAPAVLCLQHLDALGGPGRGGRDANLRAVNQVIGALDGQDGHGVYVFATTDAPWSLDPSLRRHGRFERTIFVTPPDQKARVVILRRLLDRLGDDDVELHDVALLTDGFSGHDLERLVRLADERRMRRREGRRRGPLLVDDLKASLPHVVASSGPWFDRAKAEAHLEPDETVYAGLREYLKARGRW